MKPLLYGLAILAALLAVGAGLREVGSPATARAEREDRARIYDIQQIATALVCVESGEELPQTLNDDTYLAYCTPRAPNVRSIEALLQPGDAKTYRYENTGARTYRLCADFVDLARLVSKSARKTWEVDIDVQAGCIAFDISNGGSVGTLYQL